MKTEDRNQSYVTDEDKDVILITLLHFVVFLRACVVGLVICAIISVLCGCSRVTSDNLETHTIEETSYEQTDVHNANNTEVGANESKAEETWNNLFTSIVDDSLDISVKITEYGDDGQPKKVTEAAIHHGKRESTKNNISYDNSKYNNTINVVTNHQSDSAIVSTNNTKNENIKRVVKKEGWWHTNWRWAITTLAAAIMIALGVWQRRRWLPIVIHWIRRFVD